MTLVAAAGDIVLMRPLREGPDSLLGALRDAPVTIANLEVPLTAASRPAREGLVLRGDPALIGELAGLGVRVLSMANNHCGDWGWPALLESAGLVRGAGMLPLGVGEDAGAAWAPVLVEGVSVLGCNCLPPHDLGGHMAGVDGAWAAGPLLSAIAAGRRRGGGVAGLMHWGPPPVARPAPAQRELARSLVAAGASAVFGCHAHALQAVEIIQGVPVFYGLGSLVFQSAGPRAGTFERDVAIARVELDRAGRARAAELVIGRIGPDGGPLRAHPARVERVVEGLVAAGEDWGAELRQADERVTVVL